VLGEALDLASADLTVPRGLQWLIADAAEDGPALVLVDDHQWADRPSVAFIDYQCGDSDPYRCVCPR
jgi:hypothetical protein